MLDVIMVMLVCAVVMFTVSALYQELSSCKTQLKMTKARLDKLKELLQQVVDAADDETEQAGCGTVFFPYEDVRKLLDESNQEGVEGPGT